MHWHFENQGLNVLKLGRIVAKLGMSLAGGKAQLFAEQRFLISDPYDFGTPLKFWLPLWPMGPKISNNYKTSGSTDPAEILVHMWPALAPSTEKFSRVVPLTRKKWNYVRSLCVINQ